MVAIEIRDQTVASSPAVGAAVSRAAEEPKRRIVSEGAMFGAATGRGRRSLWAILSLLFVLGVAVSTTMVHFERNGALDSVVKRARDEAQLVTATLTGKQLTKPVTGSSYDKLAAQIWRSVSSKGSIVAVTVWSSHGQILFSLNDSLVGNTPPEMRSLITGIAKGSGSARVLDDTVQTFTPVSKATDGPVAILEVDHPLAVVEAQIGDLWSMFRLGSVFGLAVSLLLLGLTFVSSRSLVRAPEDDERPRHAERQEGDEGADMKAEGQPKEPPTEALAPTLEEDLEALQVHLDLAVDQDEALEGDLESQESMRQWREEFQDMAHEGDFQTQESIRQRLEEFKARAKQAELRLKKLEAEPHEAPSARIQSDRRRDVGRHD